MSKASIGARVAYCGHNGWFVADIHLINGVNVVKANGPVNGGNLERDMSDVTHELVDWPRAGYWNPNIGIFVVPANQVTLVAKRPIKPATSKPKAKKKK